MTGAPPPQPYGAAPPPGAGEPIAVPYPQQPGTGPFLPAQQGGYPAPGGGYGYPGAPRPTTAALGWVALIAGVIAVLGSTINGVVVAALIRPEMFDAAAGADMAVLTSLGLVNVLLLWFLVALWAIVQGIVAMAQRRGVWQGLVGMLLGLVGPWIGVVITVSAFITAFGDVDGV